MTYTLKEATVKRCHHDSHKQFRGHLGKFLNAYSFARRLKTLQGRTPFEVFMNWWRNKLERITIEPDFNTLGLNTYALENLLPRTNWRISAAIEKVAAAFNAGVDIPDRDKSNKNPLLFVAENNESPDLARLLVDRGTDIQAADEGESKPRHLVARLSYPTSRCDHFLRIIVIGAGTVRHSDKLSDSLVPTGTASVSRIW